MKGNKVTDFILFIPRAINKRLRIKITYKTTFLYALVYLLIMMAMAMIIGRSVQNSIVQAVVYETETNITELAEYIQSRGMESAADITDYLNAEVVIVEDNRVVFSSGSIDRSVFEGSSWGNKVDDTTLTVLRRVSINGQAHSVYWQVDLSARLRPYYLLRIMFFALMPIGLLIMVGLGSIASAGMLNPIKKINEFIHDVNADNLEKRLSSVNSQDELNELTSHLNKMLDSLENSFFEQSRFVSDASHELRTPIAVVQGYANLLERWGKKDEKILDEAINAISKESENMKNLVEKLLFLARTETLTPKMQQFVLSELIEEIARETSLTATGKLKRIEITRIQPVEVVADRELIKQALRVFVDNAIKYTGDNGIIRLSCFEDGEFAVLKVVDDGIGIPKADLPYIFERFYRCDQARNRSIGSAGLGLSIAKWIVDAHKGEVEVVSEEGEGTEICIRLSIAPLIRH